MSGDNLSQLERLNRLREAGALSDSEFEEQKQSILTGKPASRFSRPMLIGGAAIIAVIGVAVLLSLWVSDSDPIETSASASPSVEATAAPLSEPPPPTATETPEVAPTISENARLSFATSDEVLGTNPAYLEQRLGVPKEKSANHLAFELGGCTVYYWSAGSRISGFSVDVGPSCSPTIRGHRIGPRTTFGEIVNRDTSGQFTADCIYACGNAADPVVGLTYRASHATGFISVQYLTDAGQASDAIDLWEQGMRRELGLSEYESPPDFEPFNCVSNPPANARRLFPRMTVRSVSVGRDQSGPCA